MPASTENITRWIEQSEIDYFTHFIKAWIPFNAWYNLRYSNLGSDREKINSIKTKLAFADFYSKDPEGFEGLAKSLSLKETKLSRLEDQWLKLELEREELEES